MHIILRTGEETTAVCPTQIPHVFALRAEGEAKRAIEQLIARQALAIPTLYGEIVTYFGQHARQIIQLTLNERTRV